MKGKTQILILLTGVLLVQIAGGCKKDKKYDPVPYAYVNIFIDPNSTLYQNLNVIGGYEYLYVDPPSRGIIVYRISESEFVAFERTCPYDPAAACARVQVESSGITAIDSCCMSRYILLDGSPFSGPATLSLKQYQTYYNGNLLHIFN
ncbi:MAG TPA: hypothetical protein P5531_01055 [Bacteroidales bacterium]|nr:hypothetical protein [Bacteroidales bacterium]HSA42244.1 hypothetical protein [Bacteroidales bacterium]